MKRASYLSFVLMFSFQVSAVDFQSIKCQGGDGPNPLSDLTGTQKISHAVFETKGRVSEFVLWEHKNTVAYRNSLGEIYELDLRTGLSRGVARSKLPLSRLKDSRERYITLESHPIALDTAFVPAKWRKWDHKGEVKHLYWQHFLRRDTLFSVSSKKTFNPEQQRLEVYSFNRKGTSSHLCNLYAKEGQHYHLGEGHVYPYIFLFRTEKKGDCTRLSYFNFKIEGELLGKPRCELYSSGQYSTLLPGNVLEVYQFPTLMQGNHNMFVVKTDHPEKNLLWDDGVYGCRYYQFGEYEPMVLNPQQAVLAVWTDAQGLNLIYPRKTINNEPVIIRPLDGLITGPIKRQHLALSDNGKELYVLAFLKDAGENSGRKLIRVILEN